MSESNGFAGLMILLVTLWNRWRGCLTVITKELGVWTTEELLSELVPAIA